jgi:hypothetical protein
MISKAGGQGLIDSGGCQGRRLSLQQGSRIRPFAHEGAIEIVATAHITQAGGELVGFVAQLANGQRTAKEIQGWWRQGSYGKAEAAAQGAGQPGEAIPDAGPQK